MLQIERTLCLALFIISQVIFQVHGQSPDLMSFQAVIRDANDELVTNSSVALKFEILKGSTNGVVAYSETQTANSNANGLVSVKIGSGNPVQGAFSDIEWGDGSYFIKSEVDPNGGANYSITGVTQLLSVPYALYARETGAAWSLEGNAITSTDFLGTTNLEDLVFKVNNKQAALLSPLETNAAFGFQALSAAGTGSNNTAMGYKALEPNTSGMSNSAFGMWALGGNTSGNNNVALGMKALQFNTTGGNNTAVGTGALGSNTGGGSNTASGYSALGMNTTGDWNVATGFEALYFNTTGGLNTAFGTRALRFNTTGGNNTAVGYLALHKNTTGNGNVSSGLQSMEANTTGSNNCAYGYGSFEANISGNANSAFGKFSLFRNKVGDNNVAMGAEALYNNDSASYNTAVGYRALSTFDGTGSNNTAIGNGTAITDNSNNSTAIGYNGWVIGSNKVVIGNSSITSIGGYTSWSNLSDERFKRNIQPLDDKNGLAFILRLEPITYHLDMEKLVSREAKMQEGQMVEPKQWEVDAFRKKGEILYSGFSAQQVRAAATAVGYEFSGVQEPLNDLDHYKISYSEFVVPLVKSVQQQQELIEKQALLISKLEERIEKLEGTKE